MPLSDSRVSRDRQAKSTVQWPWKQEAACSTDQGSRTGGLGGEDPGKQDTVHLSSGQRDSFPRYHQTHGLLSNSGAPC